MAFTVVYDANVLYPAPLRDLLIRLAMTGLFRARWTDDILDEVFRNILEDRPELKPEQLERTRELMNLAVRDALIDGHHPLMAELDLPDPDDRHVLGPRFAVAPSPSSRTTSRTSRPRSYLRTA